MKFCAKVVKFGRSAKKNPRIFSRFIVFSLPLYQVQKNSNTMSTQETRWQQFVSEMRSTYKSMDTEEWWDRCVVRPIGFVEACIGRKLHIHPNAITIVSIIIGTVSGYFFVPGQTGMVLIATLLLFFANTLDSADGQLARMTKQYSFLGRALDGLAGEFWFTSIYLGILIRMYTMPIPFTNSMWGSWGVALTVVSSLACHGTQAALADYYRVLHLHFLAQDGRSELTRSHLLQAEIATTEMPRLERLWKALFCNYTKRQERMTPQLQRLLTALEERGSAPLPQGFAEEYRQGSLPLMPWANTLSFNTRFLALVVAMLLGMPWLYLLFECTALNYLAWLMHRKHEALCKALIKKYQL